MLRSKWSGEERIKNLNIGLFKSQSIDSPLIKECNASLACKLTGTKTIGSGFVVFGEITEAFISEEIARAEGEEKYKTLDQALYLEDGVYGTIGNISKIE
jgi:flavin reductase (DIM6/NTAB) family NADH-FMN oxidoreductase RutF